MLKHKELNTVELKNMIQKELVNFGGNKRLKIYGLLSCKSGKRMKIENRVFFTTEQEAIENGYRPCGHCMKETYKLWKNGVI